MQFGTVAAGAFQIRAVRLANAGTDVAGTTDDNLLFAVRDEAGAWVPRLPEVTGPDFKLESVVAPPGGISAGQAFEWQVRFSPTSSGVKQGRLTIHSNDPEVPAAVVALEGLGQELPPCTFGVRPSRLEFGAVRAGESLTRSFQVENRGQTECHVSVADLAAETRAAFALVEGPTSDAVVAPGSALVVKVRFAPGREGVHSGEVRLYTSSTTAPETIVGLGGNSASSCLQGSPMAIDFGVIPTSCSSRERTLTFANTCEEAISVTQVEVSDCAEIVIGQKPALPLSL